MRVLMFGWEFPPHIAGGLGTACYGLTRGLARNDVEVIFVVPRAYGDEDRRFVRVVNASDIEVPFSQNLAEADADVWNKMTFIQIDSNLVPYTTPEEYFRYKTEYEKTGTVSSIAQGRTWRQKYAFSGMYGANLMEEVARYAMVAAHVAEQLKGQFDVIHAHDWLTYPAGVHAKMVSGKPLCIHVHATDFDRSRGKVNPTVYSMEKNGMDYADCIMCVSELTRRTVIEQYHQNPKKVFAMHNAVYPLSQEYQDIPRPDHSKEKIVTFLGRITMQKGPEYFVEAASLVLQRARNIRFVMAGSGDMMDAMINLAAERGIADRFHFPGFMKGKQVYEVYKNSDVFVMPSVSEPFGIAPLEAMQCGTPSIISKQSGCGEILDKVIKTDYWDIHAMADAIYSLCTNPALFQYLQEEGRKEVDGITWEKVGLRIRALYEDVLRNYGK